MQLIYHKCDLNKHNRVVTIGSMNKRKLHGTLGERLRFARELLGMSQAELAVRVGCSQGAIGNIERNLRDGRGETLINAAEALKIRYKWLKDGQGEVESPWSHVEEQVTTYAVKPKSEARVPLLTHEEAYHWRSQNYQPPSDVEWVTVHRTDLGRGAFGLKVIGEAMAWNGVPTFPEGALLIISVQREPMASDYVVAHDGASSRVTFKKLTTDGLTWYLKPLNSEFKTIEIASPQAHVIGVAVEYWFGGTL